MAKQLLFVGMAGGLALAVGLAMVFSAITTPQHSADDGSPRNGRRFNGTRKDGCAIGWHACSGNGSMFNANGTSMVDNVQITGASISGSEQKQVQDVWF